MPELNNFDFSGWITKFEVPCTDGRTIKEGAFKDFDGQVLPLMWQHDHGNPDNTLGNILVEYVPGEGLYGYGSFNETSHSAKEAVRHGDITEMSIFANHLQSFDGDVYDGCLKEVSLVLRGANPEAYIDNVMIHGDVDEESAYINCHSLIDVPYIAHGDEDYEGEENMTYEEGFEPEYDENFELGDIIDTMDPDGQALVSALFDEADGLAHSDMDDLTEDEMFYIMSNMDPLQLAAMEEIIYGLSEELEHSDEDEYLDDMDVYLEQVMLNMDPDQLEAMEIIIDQLNGNLSHADIDDEALADIMDTMDPDAIDLINALYEEAGFEELEHSDEDMRGAEIYGSMNPTQQAFFRFCLGKALMANI